MTGLEMAFLFTYLKKSKAAFKILCGRHDLIRLVNIKFTQTIIKS